MHELRRELDDQCDQGWFRADNSIIDVYGELIGANGIAVYMVLARRANRDGLCFPSIASIGRNTCLSPNTVRNALQRLQAVGLLTIQQRKIEGKKENDSNLYQLMRPCTSKAEVLPIVNHRTSNAEGRVPQILSSKDDSIEQDSLNKTHIDAVASQSKSVRKTKPNKKEGQRQTTSVKETIQTPNPVPPPPSPIEKPKITPVLKDAMAVLISGKTDAWKIGNLASAMSKALREITSIEPTLTPERLQTFGQYWQKRDWRGQRGNKPQAHQVANEWITFQQSQEGRQNGQAGQSAAQSRDSINSTNPSTLRSSEEVAAIIAALPKARIPNYKQSKPGT